MKKRLLIIDGKNFVFRQHFTRRFLQTSNGEPTSVLYGGLIGLSSLIRKYPGWDIVFVWDGGGKTWRHKLYPEYKANRKKSKEAYAALSQIPTFRRLIEILGFAQIVQDGVEADDLIGILSRIADFDLGYHDIVIHSTDQDFYQLVSPKIKILANTEKLGRAPLGLLQLEQITGVNPYDWVSYRALMGDKGDNIPALRPGIGPKTAQRMVRRGVRAVYDSFDGLNRKNRNEYPWLRTVWRKFLRNRRLCTIETRVTKRRVRAIPAALAFGRRALQRDWSNVKSRYDQFVSLCARYELLEVLGRRHLFFRKAQKKSS